MKSIRNVLSGLTTLVRSQTPRLPIGNTPSAHEVLWLDHPDAEELIYQRTRDLELARHAQNLIHVGLTRLEGAIDGALCDRLIDEFHAYCRRSREAPAFADSWGYHSRLVNFHMESDAALSIGLNAGVLRLLDFLFGYRATPYASLTFERGTEQALHRDSPFFHTQPSGFFFGVWTALEDVHPEAGPLTYYPGGHRIPINPREVGARYRGQKNEKGAMFAEYSAAIASACEAAGLKRESVLPKKGDVLIWHPSLPHSGSRIAERTRTRKSIVFHYLPEGMPIHALEHFFNPPNTRVTPQPPKYLSRFGRPYHLQSPPMFQQNV